MSELPDCQSATSPAALKLNLSILVSVSNSLENLLKGMKLSCSLSLWSLSSVSQLGQQ